MLGGISAQAYFDSRRSLGFPLAPEALRKEVLAAAEAADDKAKSKKGKKAKKAQQEQGNA